jgi:hypothetical protein
LIKRFAANQGVDAFVTLLHELDPFAVQKYYLLPALERMRNAVGIKRQVGVTHHFRFLGLLFQSFGLSQDPNRGVVATIKDLPLFHALRFAFVHHGRPHAEASRAGGGENSSEAAFVASFDEGSEDVSVSDLSVRHPFIQEVARSSSWWGLEHVRALVAAEELIRSRLADADGSLDAILG